MLYIAHPILASKHLSHGMIAERTHGQFRAQSFCSAPIAYPQPTAVANAVNKALPRYCRYRVTSLLNMVNPSCRWGAVNQNHHISYLVGLSAASEREVSATAFMIPYPKDRIRQSALPPVSLQVPCAYSLNHNFTVLIKVMSTLFGYHHNTKLGSVLPGNSRRVHCSHPVSPSIYT